jgi:hypothetical protein
MVEIQRNVRVEINGYSDEDIRDQAKSYFGLVEPTPQSCEKKYHKSKIALVKLLREFDKQYFGKYDDASGQLVPAIGLMNVKKFVEEQFGEPE